MKALNLSPQGNTPPPSGMSGSIRIPLTMRDREQARRPPGKVGPPDFLNVAPDFSPAGIGLPRTVLRGGGPLHGPPDGIRAGGRWDDGVTAPSRGSADRWTAAACVGVVRSGSGGGW
nr:hypothetical protein KPHV_65070 [Kitasatospora purpeofusca]